MTNAPSALADDLNETFEELGAGQLAYVRRVSPSDLKKMFPDAELQDADLPAWALLAADGTPLVLTDTRNAAIANAIENDLEALSVH